MSEWWNLQGGFKDPDSARKSSTTQVGSPMARRPYELLKHTELGGEVWSKERTFIYNDGLAKVKMEQK